MIESPVDADFIIWFKAPAALTLTRMDCIVDPADSGESIDIDIQECDGAGDSCVDSDSTPVTCNNAGASKTSFTDAAVDSGDWVAINMASAPTGTITQLSLTLQYRMD